MIDVYRYFGKHNASVFCAEDGITSMQNDAIFMGTTMRSSDLI
jgi:hypothetical protein